MSTPKPTWSEHHSLLYIVLAVAQSDGPLCPQERALLLPVLRQQAPTMPPKAFLSMFRVVAKRMGKPTTGIAFMQQLEVVSQKYAEAVQHKKKLLFQVLQNLITVAHIDGLARSAEFTIITLVAKHFGLLPHVSLTHENGLIVLRKIRRERSGN